MQNIKIPTADIGSESIAQSKIPNRSPLFNKETNTLYMKYKENLIPLGSEVAYTKGIDAFYFRGKYDEITQWPDFGYTSVIYLLNDCEIEDEIKEAGFWVNIGKDKPDWKPFCNGNSDITPNYFSVGAIFMYVGTNVPTGYYQCDGSEISIEENQDLFTMIGYSFGEAKDGYFKLPLLKDNYLSYIIKAKRDTYDKNIGVIHMFGGTETPKGYIDLKDSKFDSLENFELALLLAERFGSDEERMQNLPILLNNHTKFIVKSKNTRSIPVGLISMTTTGMAQEGFIDCDGSAASKASYSELYGVLKGNFGENATTFNLPKLKTDYLDFSIKVGKVVKNTL